MKQESLTTKIIIWAGICMFITAGIIVAYSVSTIRNTTLDSAKEETVAKAYGEAANIRGELSSPLDTARTIAQVLGKVRNPTNPLDIQREETFDLLRTILLDNEQFVGVYTCWEPNAYDFMDSGYRKERGHDISGRFAPYWQRNQVGAPTLRPLLTSQSHSSDGKPGAWYKKTKQSLQEYIRNPFPSLVTATLTTSTIQPILGNDQFYGIVGIDLNLSFIQTMADRFNFFANSGKMLVLSNNGTIAGFTGRPEAVGKHIEETDKNFAEFLPLMQMEMEFTIVKQGQLFAFVPLTINNSTAPWFVSISVPIDKVTETATILMQKQIILFVGILFALIILAAVGAHSIITKPLTSLLKGIQKIGDGDFTHEVKINSKDEIGELAEIFNQMRIKLKSIQDYLSNIIDSMPSLLVGVKPDGTITQWNKEAQKRTGISPENALGKPLYTIIPHLKAEMVKIAEAIETGQSQIDPKKIRYIEGKLCCEDITIYPLDGDGIEGAVIRVDDVSREYTLAEQLDQSRKMDAIGQLAGGVAHDFNNMLAGIMGAAQLLKSPKRNLDRRSIEFVDMILGASERAADLTTKLLAFGRKKSIAPTDIDVHNTIDDAVAILDKTIDKK
ncbi:HAMP domain-containing protein, partial [bacterium]|nr:HAMP domain-containing protein [bacterium]